MSHHLGTRDKEETQQTSMGSESQRRRGMAYERTSKGVNGRVSTTRTGHEKFGKELKKKKIVVVVAKISQN